MKSIALLTLAIIGLGLYPLIANTAGFAIPTDSKSKNTGQPDSLDIEGKTILHLSGSTTVSNVMNLLADHFEQSHEDIALRLTGGGSSSAVKAMLSDADVIGQMSRPMKDKEREKYKVQYGYEPIEIKIAVDALAIYTHRDNPLQQLSIEQLSSIFIEYKQGNNEPSNSAPVVKWGDLDFTVLNSEPWQSAPIEVYGLPSFTGAYSMFRKKVLNKQDFNVRMKSYPTSSSIVQATGVEKNAISFSSSFYATKKTHFVALQAEDGHYYLPEEQSVVSLQYPLARYLYLYINPKPKNGISAELKQFVAFLMAADTQQLIRRAGFYPVAVEIRESQAVRIK